MAENSWDIRQRLRGERDRAGLTLAQLANVTGLSKTYLVRLENQPDANPSLDVLRRLADALDITIADLLDTPAMRFKLDEAEMPTSLKAYASEEELTPRELQTLASIRWRRGEEPRTSERWRFIRQSLRASRELDDVGNGDNDG
jgi:transcriptional regulator with XRE-family HTH domain